MWFKRLVGLCIILLIICAVFVFVFISHIQQEKERASLNSMNTPPYYETYEISEEQEVWMQTHVNFALLRLMQEYPIASIRTQLEDGYTRLQKREYFFVMSGKEHPATTIFATVEGQVVWVEERQRPAILLFVPTLMEMYDEYEDVEAYEDRLIILYLHELFHAVHQPPQTGTPTYEESLELESEAWWDTIGNVVKPMVDEGRLTDKDHAFLVKAVTAYENANGDRSSSSWQNFVKTTLPPSR